MRTHVPAKAALVLLLLTSAYGEPSFAVNASRSKVSTAAGLCQAALPTFEGLIRKRPLAVQNEGVEAAFVTCSYTSDTQASGSNGNTSFVASFINQSPAPVAVNCTAVIGSTSGTATYIPKVSPLIPANGAAPGSTAWTSADNGGFIYGPHLPVSLSCNLPPGVGIVTLTITATVEVGD